MMKFKKCEVYLSMSKGVQKTNGYYLEEYPDIIAHRKVFQSPELFKTNWRLSDRESGLAINNETYTRLTGAFLAITPAFVSTIQNLKEKRKDFVNESIEKIRKYKENEEKLKASKELLEFFIDECKDKCEDLSFYSYAMMNKLSETGEDKNSYDLISQFELNISSALKTLDFFEYYLKEYKNNETDK